ncbi:hypothetical protein IFR05_003082 [Cadophora sp. M221]|nr:hypothetical protein IFR05_003082 [Cadophora sp. M221]
MPIQQVPSLSELEIIEQSHPDNLEFEEDDYPEFSNHGGRARRVSICDLNFGGLEISPRASRAPRRSPELLPQCRTTPRILPLHLLSENALRIREVRNFLAIPESVATASIPAFFKKHLRMTEAISTGIFLTRGRIFPHRPYVWIVGADRAHMDEICDSLKAITWEDDRDSDSESCTSSETSATLSESYLSPRFFDDLIGLDEEDERAFWEAVDNCRIDTTRLAEVKQRPRLRTNPSSPHNPSYHSPLRKELHIRSIEFEPYESEE